MVLLCLFLPHKTGTTMSCWSPASFSALPDRIATDPRDSKPCWWGGISIIHFAIPFLHVSANSMCSHLGEMSYSSGCICACKNLNFFGSGQCQSVFWAIPEAAPSSPWLLPSQHSPEMSLGGVCCSGWRKKQRERWSMWIPPLDEIWETERCVSVSCFCSYQVCPDRLWHISCHPSSF